MGGIFGQVLSLTIIFTPWLLLAIFLMVLISEFGVSIPCLMETVWLFSGYNLVMGNISIEHLIMFCVVGIVGRIAGSSALFYISWYGKTPFRVIGLGYIQPKLAQTFYNIQPLKRLINQLKPIAHWVKSGTFQLASNKINDSKALRLFGRGFNLSPFTVALGRFLWLRLPITIASGASKQRTALFFGVVIFSVVWDGAYITFGVLGGQNGLEPGQMLLYPLGVMIALSTVVFGIKQLHTRLASN